LGLGVDIGGGFGESGAGEGPWCDLNHGFARLLNV